ncbi:uncharacterized protein LOC143564074 [Bidens hawaiensis]|uniref:uncharacterized protein LOC143564074 n=1 Tax=Bidens hawaiensis TaxID=980011 RepID=UPI00404AC2C1
MEGVGARLGRSSSRYGAATVFTGPVRKWKKKWIHVTPNTPSSDNNNNKHHHSNGNANTNNNNNNEAASHILLYKWTPIRKTHNDDHSNGDDDTADDEPPRRKMKYIPIALLEEQNNEAQTDEAKPVEDDPIAPEADPSSKPDMNDAPMEENQVSESTEKLEHNKGTVGLSLNLNARDDDGDEESEDQPNGS